MQVIADAAQRQAKTVVARPVVHLAPLAVGAHVAWLARTASAGNALIQVIRFELDPRNKEVLKNMCNGMRGKNTETLTYRGTDRSERSATRKEAGCVKGFCAKQIAAGLVPVTFNSCDEYPPASSLEGGNARNPLQRAVNCIPARENSIQGGQFGGFQSTLRRLGITFQRGDKFVISINCDDVLGSLAPRGVGLERRDDGDTISMSGNETVDSTLVFEENQKLRYLLVPLGDLAPGTYKARINCLSGSTVGAYVLDNEGFNITANDAGIIANQAQEYDFNLDFDTPGVGVLIGTMNNSTRITWTFEGTESNGTTTSTTPVSSTAPVSGSASASSNMAQVNNVPSGSMSIMWLFAFFLYIVS
ncbi:hypothetical protein BU17DRAFT_98331 [Hysterangium stoloniferum]|nr:hypothetical protein BU17DRAFT_98331 [Hysterangium stoloniferum]